MKRTISLVNTPSPSAASATGDAPPTSNLRCISYAIRTIFRVLPALGRSSDHLNPPPGLGIKHFVVAGVICALLLVSTIVGAVSAILSVVSHR